MGGALCQYEESPSAQAALSKSGGKFPARPHGSPKRDEW